MKYAELHCHSAFSLLNGASTPEELVSRAKELNLSALALTDHNDLGGIVRFAQAAKEVCLEAIVGAEITLEDASHLTLLATTVEGYKNLCRLISQARSSNPRGKPQVSYADLITRAKGLVALSGCPRGRIPASIAADNLEQARRHTTLMLEAFDNNFFFELWNHHLTQELVIAQQMLALAKHYSIPWVVTNNVHYASPGKRIVHDVLTCLRHNVTLSTAGRKLRPNGSWYLKSPQEIAHLWRHDLQGLHNTQAVAERCQFRLGLLKPSLPIFATAGQSSEETLSQLVWQGAAKRYGQLTDKHRRQLQHELALINKLKLEPYFLIMWDIIRFAESQGIAVQGRGSAANSAVCYCLAITAVDPIGMDLLFERFLSEGRNEPPDIDLDIAHQEREKVLQYVYDKYGREHTAMVCETITYRGRSAIKDAARVLDFSPEQAQRLAAEGHHHEAWQAAQALAAGGAARAGLDQADHRVQSLIKVVSGLHKLPRHRSIHVGGFVLSGEPLGEMVPVEPASMPGRTVIQWDKDDLGPVGMIKIDLLGLGMLTMIQEAKKLVKQHRNIDLDLAHLNMNDPAIFDMLSKADTVGIFQVESRAQMSILPRLKPKCFYDIVVSIALIRPGPIQGNVVHPYMRRRRGEEAVTYLHPSLEPVLKRTLGVPLFQEQGMRLAVIAAGFTAAQADQLRRIMSFKRSHEKLPQVYADLAHGMRNNGFSQEAINSVTQQLEGFASYGFPESHSASFALLAYASAYLKRYFAPEFYCALLNAQPMGFYSPATLLRDAQRHNVEIRPVDLAKSIWDCTLENPGAGCRCAEVVRRPLVVSLPCELPAPPTPPALRIGLRYVQGLGPQAKAALEAAWKRGGPFVSIEDVCARSGLSQKSLQILARAGAFESFCPERREALWKILSLTNKKDLPLFKTVEFTASQTPNMIPAMNDLERTAADYQTMQLSIGQHPMAYYRSWANQQNISACADLLNKQNNKLLTIAGSVICRQRPSTAKGFVFLTLEDETGTANVIVRPNTFEEYRQIILNHGFLAITGKLQSEDGVINLIARSINHLPKLPGNPQIPSHNFH